MLAVLLGDSHTAGPYGQALATDLATMGFTAQRLAQVGIGVPGWLERLAGARPPVDPAELGAVIVTLGTNDYWREAEPWAHAVAELAAVLEEWSPRARLVWVSAPVLEKADVTWQLDVLEDVLPDRWTIIDSTEITVPLERSPDGTHYPGQSGARWAQAVVDVLVAADGGTSRTSARTWAVVAGGAVALVAVFSFIRHLGARR